MEYVRWFEDLGRESVPIAGGKGANLAEMLRAGLPVPPGFVVSLDAFDSFVAQACLQSRIADRVADLDVEDTRALEATARDIETWIQSAAVPTEVQRAVSTAYADLSRRAHEDGSFVAARSSGAVEDAADKRAPETPGVNGRAVPVTIGG